MTTWAVRMSTKTRGDFVLTSNKQQALASGKCSNATIVSPEDLERMCGAVNAVFSVFPGSRVEFVGPVDKREEVKQPTKGKDNE